MEKKGLIYMDHAATTPARSEVIEAMLPYFAGKFGNPSSVYRIGRESREDVEAVREQTARALGAEPEEICFTAGGTESDNWAIKGVAYANRHQGKHIITSAIEHHAVLHTCEYLEQHGFEVTYLPVDRYGSIDPGAVSDAITDKTILISVMFANNEIGTIEPVAGIGRIARDHGIPFHTDAVQAVGNLPIDVDEMKIDLLSLSAHKFYGPKGVGALYIREGVKIDGFIHGGGQEGGRRAGTENLPGIIGLGKAVELAAGAIKERSAHLREKRSRLTDGILGSIPHTSLNGHPELRLPGNVSVTFRDVSGESVLRMLDEHGVCVSTGSACTSGSLRPSHVLLATGLTPEEAHGTVRFTLGRTNTLGDIEYVLDVLPGIIDDLRQTPHHHGDACYLYRKSGGRTSSEPL